MENALKAALHEQCLQQVEQRIATAKAAMDAAQAAANNEGKSSAGDKYETGRAMMQLERDQHARSLAEALKLKRVLHNIDPGRSCEQVQLGCIAITGAGNFYLSISLGKLSVNGKDYLAVSPASPIGTQLLGKKKGEAFSFNQKKIEIVEVD